MSIYPNSQTDCLSGVTKYGGLGQPPDVIIVTDRSYLVGMSLALGI